MRELILWLRQGRPTEMPVILVPGFLIVTGSGGMHLTNWTFGVGRMSVDFEEALQDQEYRERIWEYCASRYPERVVWVTKDQWDLMLRGVQQ